jgi:hypothetical protein
VQKHPDLEDHGKLSALLKAFQHIVKVMGLLNLFVKLSSSMPFLLKIVDEDLRKKKGGPRKTLTCVHAD